MTACADSIRFFGYIPVRSLCRISNCEVLPKYQASKAGSDARWGKIVTRNWVAQFWEEPWACSANRYLS